MKKMLTFFLAITMLLSATIYAAEQTPSDSKVEISFKIGDRILQINGKSIEVETPFVENDVTLVPLRVITEAFGAQVLWDEDAQKITLTYNDVTIVLTIGDRFVLVNSVKKELLAAPMIVKEKTMVPLRFITENFGASVTYDDATGAITVVKPASQTTDNTAQGSADTPNVTISDADANGYRTYTNKKMKVSLQFLSELVHVTDGSNEGEIIFYRYNDARVLDGFIYLSVFKLEDGASVADIANKDRDAYAAAEKDAIYTCSELKAGKEFSGLETKTYTCTYRKSVINNMFACSGKYGYALKYLNNNARDEPATDKPIIKSIKADQLNYDEAGDLKVWQQNADTTTYQNAGFYLWEYSITVPSAWRRTDDNDELGDSLTFADESGMYINIQTIKPSAVQSQPTNGRVITSDHRSVSLPDNVERLLTSYHHYFQGPKVKVELDKERLSDPFYITKSPYRQFCKNNVNEFRCYENGKFQYLSFYYFLGRNDKLYIIAVNTPEELCTPATMAMMDRILQSIQIAPLN